MPLYTTIFTFFSYTKHTINVHRFYVYDYLLLNYVIVQILNKIKFINLILG